MNKTYAAVKIELANQITTDGYANKGELVVGNLKAGSTSRSPEQRMNEYGSAWTNSHTNETTCYLGEFEGEKRVIWTQDCDYAWSRLDSDDLFYQRRVRNFREAEQRLINTNRKLAEEYAKNEQVKLILHHGLPHDNRSNPAPYEKGINPSYYRLVKKTIKTQLKQAVKRIPDLDKEVVKLRKEIAQSQDRLSELALQFKEQQQELLQIKI
tara:strand:+ start:4835 stop:5467 length:633 start_codon:yes stop_codon:yes gene_type:complete